MWVGLVGNKCERSYSTIHPTLNVVVLVEIRPVTSMPDNPVLFFEGGYFLVQYTY